MALLARHRRPLAFALLALLVAPALAMPFAPKLTVSDRENRTLASAPTWPETPGEWRALPKALDAYFTDHFAFRETLIANAAALERAIGGRLTAARAEGAPKEAMAPAVMGRNGQMFLTEGLLQSNGHDYDPDRAADYAGFVCEMHDRLAPTGVQVAAAIAPSPGEILPELLPQWAGEPRPRTEYDLVLAALKRCGVPATDLRSKLRELKPNGRKLYRQYDSHWTQYAALAAYSAAVDVMGKPEWRIGDGDVAWATVQNSDGDLPRMAGLDPQAETVEIHDMTLPGTMTKQELTGLKLQPAGEVARPYTIETGRQGPSVLVIGDSYTGDFFPPLFARFAGRVSWIHMDTCGFDWAVIDRVKPAYVLIMPVERAMRCNGDRPWKAD